MNHDTAEMLAFHEDMARSIRHVLSTLPATDFSAELTGQIDNSQRKNLAWHEEQIAKIKAGNVRATRHACAEDLGLPNG